MSAPREALADLLWSNAERQKAMQSLRQALRQLKTAEQETGRDIVLSSAGHVQLDPETFSSDLTEVLELLDKGRAEDFVQAGTLWRGEFLAGFEDIDPEFSDWLTVERERLRSQVISAAFRHLNQTQVEDGGAQVEAGAQFLLKVDPALETAHRVLIRLYMQLGQRERATQQFKTCEREMRLHLDEAPDQETQDLLKHGEPVPGSELVMRQVVEAVSSGSVYANGEEPIRLPEISVVSSALYKNGLQDAIHLREEIVSGLSSFRSFDLFESDYFDDESMPKPALLEGHELGSYLLRFRHDQRSGKIVVQFEDRTSGQIVFNEITNPALIQDVASVASQIVRRIHIHATGRLRNPANTSVFARWCQVESLLWDFTPQSDEKAMRLLDDLERTNRSFSMIYAGKASVIMKQELHFPVYDKTTSDGLNGLLDLAERAIVLDPWQAVNQRVYGWAAILSNMPEEARRAFQHAGRLSSADPANLMSVAEGLALSGDVAEAKNTADRAFSLFSFVPRVFYEYLANICFAAEDYETAIRQTEKGAGVTVGGLTTRVAALVCSGREHEALQTLRRFSEHRITILKNSPDFVNDPVVWRTRVNFFQDAKVRANFDKGAALVQRFLFDGAGSV
ncbi:BTAD domain-containing putative transcriptional regulator [Roseibium aggregatum]|uniref:Bacterial transcriptional activator domain-containing protein n=1 Tax=Roseibium aggregatum TaxID=187304 RepID=A0A939EE11_9HYPH|nr:BTAD domain-containing putative transcriptional regulator [Roseibium aggregatum]MBN9670403.1 hypothetical protein [Roseibium aggregatum]